MNLHMIYQDDEDFGFHMCVGRPEATDIFCGVVADYEGMIYFDSISPMKLAESCPVCWQGFLDILGKAAKELTMDDIAAACDRIIAQDDTKENE